MLRYKTKTRPGLVALYDIRPGNGAGPFWQPRSPHGDVGLSVSKITQNVVEFRRKLQRGEDVLFCCTCYSIKFQQMNWLIDWLIDWLMWLNERLDFQGDPDHGIGRIDFMSFNKLPITNGAGWVADRQTRALHWLVGCWYRQEVIINELTHCRSFTRYYRRPWRRPCCQYLLLRRRLRHLIISTAQKTVWYPGL